MGKHKHSADPWLWRGPSDHITPSDSHDTGGLSKTGMEEWRVGRFGSVAQAAQQAHGPWRPTTPRRNYHVQAFVSAARPVLLYEPGMFFAAAAAALPKGASAAGSPLLASYLCAWT